MLNIKCNSIYSCAFVKVHQKGSSEISQWPRKALNRERLHSGKLHVQHASFSFTYEQGNYCHVLRRKNEAHYIGHDTWNISKLPWTQ